MIACLLLYISAFLVIYEDMTNQNLNSVCPECKNDVNLETYTNLAPGHVIECNHCGITLLVTAIEDGSVKTEITDEGK